jgi:hypothetical protein
LCAAERGVAIGDCCSNRSVSSSVDTFRGSMQNESLRCCGRDCGRSSSGAAAAAAVVVVDVDVAVVERGAFVKKSNASAVDGIVLCVVVDGVVVETNDDARGASFFACSRACAAAMDAHEEDDDDNSVVGVISGTVVVDTAALESKSSIAL